MARVIAILKALSVAYRRDWTAFQSLAGNNFFLATVFFLGNAGSFIYLILGLVLLFPLSTDPLRKIPPSRLALWPLDGRDRWILRLASPWINPLTGAAGSQSTVSRTMTFGLWGLIASIFAAGFLLDLPFVSARVVALFPNLPRRRNWSAITCARCFRAPGFCALILSLSAIGFAWRVSPCRRLPAE
jgi:hypothetical protein